MHDFLTLDYVPGPQTAFQGIREIPPAHWMRIDAEGRVELNRYWDLPFDVDPEISERQATEESMALLEEAVRRRLIADVPLGVLLSGGMDSSALVALMHRLGVQPIRTFSVGFEEPSFDERRAAQTVARHFGTVHRDVVVTPGRVRELLQRTVRFLDEPYADGSAIPTYCVSEIAREDVVVLLSGEGGDEAFSGYETHGAYKVARMARRIPRPVRNGVLTPLVGVLPVSHAKLSLEFRLKRFLGGLDLDPVAAHLWWRIVLTEAQKRELYDPRILEALTPEAPARHFQAVYEASNALDPLGKLLHVDSAVFLPDDLMIKNDRMTMAHSLEARVPFTDPELTEYLSRVPTGVKFPGLRKKHLLRSGMAGLLPVEILRKKKFGLELPYSRWLTTELNDLLHRYCDGGRVADTGLFRPEAVDALVRDHLSFRHDHGRALWGLLNFMMWHEAYIG
jgi:asparagine synthase (glutamine-hydrolysing)